MKKNFPLALYLSFSVSIFLLLVLGTWQLNKNFVVNKNNKNFKNKNQENAVILFSLPDKIEDLTYVKFSKVNLTNNFLYLEPRTFKGQVGYHKISVIQVDGRYLLMNEGFITAKESIHNNIKKKQEIEGYIITVPEPKFFELKNDIINKIWYTLKLEDFEKEHRFFNQINDIYNKVTSASPINNSIKLRNRVDADFSELFEYVPYIIKGIKNLPEKPTNIFIYNHLTAIEENKLANGYSFSLDSHFISSKILLHKYGNGGIRIVRSSRKDEFWRSGYYSRLGNIEIHNKESDWIEETSEEKKFRKEKLFIEAQKAFDSNFSLVIAPEGTSDTEDNLTTKSPGPFKPGAFLLADKLKSLNI